MNNFNRFKFTWGFCVWYPVLHFTPFNRSIFLLFFQFRWSFCSYTEPHHHWVLVLQDPLWLIHLQMPKWSLSKSCLQRFSFFSFSYFKESGGQDFLWFFAPWLLIFTGKVKAYNEWYNQNLLRQDFKLDMDTHKGSEVLRHIFNTFLKIIINFTAMPF